jgi:hypothetical protein
MEDRGKSAAGGATIGGGAAGEGGGAEAQPSTNRQTRIDVRTRGEKHRGCDEVVPVASDCRTDYVFAR